VGEHKRPPHQKKTLEVYVQVPRNLSQRGGKRRAPLDVPPVKQEKRGEKPAARTARTRCARQWGGRDQDFPKAEVLIMGQVHKKLSRPITGWKYIKAV